MSNTAKNDFSEYVAFTLYLNHIEKKLTKDTMIKIKDINRPKSNIYLKVNHVICSKTMFYYF